MADQTERVLCVSKIQRTCTHDGPGLRSTVFFKGCNLRCLWCQNPENLLPEPGEGDRLLTPEDIVTEVQKDHLYYQSTGGGATLSGGEPLLQDTALLKDLLQRFRAVGIPTAVETTLHVDWEAIQELAPYIDLFLLDLKAAEDSVHKALTGQSAARIHENLKRLLARPEVNLLARMVVVPGKNDSVEQISAMVEFLKEQGLPKIELLLYYNLHEDKAARLGLTVPRLGISSQEALEALKVAARQFEISGIEVHSDRLQEKPVKAKFTPRVNRIRKVILESPREVCFETANLKTEYYKKYNGFRKSVHIHRAERLYYVLDKRSVRVYDDELLVGNFTAKRVAGQVWEEQFGVMFATFLYKGEKMKPVPFISTPQERRKFYKEIIPYWVPRCVVGRFVAEHGIQQLLQSFSSVAEQKVGFNNNFAAIAHFIVNFDRLLNLGTIGLKKEIHQAKREHPENNQTFYKGCLVALQALERFGERYAEALESLSRHETSQARRRELSRMAAVCRHVPKYPARTFHEALQSMLFLQIALCAESFENAISYGRLDQILAPYYERDVKAGILTYDQARELLALWVLKMDECIEVNDGDSLFNISKLFETVSTDQTLTFGGLTPEGEDGTNDVTYMLLDICELQPLCANMCARIHPGSPQKYLDRLAELYIGGCPMPELFSDDAYVKSLQLHYDVPVESARNYAIVGCVEPNASSEHFGNTDSANINVTLPLLQAMKGKTDDLWNYNAQMQLEKYVTRGIDYFTGNKGGLIAGSIHAAREADIERREAWRGTFDYKPPGDMTELLQRYQERLTALAKSILADQQKIEAVLSKHFTTPLASTLFSSCVQRGKDAYEGGTDFNSAGIQAVGITDAADSLYTIEQLVFVQKKYTIEELCRAIDENFEGENGEQIHADIEKLAKFGDNQNDDNARWVTKVMEMYNLALAECPYDVRGGKYAAGYYALNTSDRYGKYMGALPSGRKKSVPLANSVTPHYGAVRDDLLSALSDVAKVDFVRYAPNGSTVTFTVDAALFQGESGVKNLSGIFRTFLTNGGMQFQPNVIDRALLQEAYEHPELHPYLMVRIAGYCSYFQELSDDLKLVLINRTCYG